MISVQKSAPASLNRLCVVATWPNMPNGEDGQPLEIANMADRSVQVHGTFGAGGSLRIEGSLDGDNFFVLTDPQGNALDITTAKIEAISELARFIRPRVTAGDGTTNLTVTILFKGA
jgi:hypothetical protein